MGRLTEELSLVRSNNIEHMDKLVLLTLGAEKKLAILLKVPGPHGTQAPLQPAFKHGAFRLRHLYPQFPVNELSQRTELPVFYLDMTEEGTMRLSLFFRLQYGLLPPFF